MIIRKVIKSGNLPTYMPFNLTAITYLLLDKFHAPEWLWGVSGAFFLLLWIGCITLKLKEEEVDILNKK